MGQSRRRFSKRFAPGGAQAKMSSAGSHFLLRFSRRGVRCSAPGGVHPEPPTAPLPAPTFDRDAVIDAAVASSGSQCACPLQVPPTASPAAPPPSSRDLRRGRHASVRRRRRRPRHPRAPRPRRCRTTCGSHAPRPRRRRRAPCADPARRARRAAQRARRALPAGPVRSPAASTGVPLRLGVPPTTAGERRAKGPHRAAPTARAGRARRRLLEDGGAVDDFATPPRATPPPPRRGTAAVYEPSLFREAAPARRRCVAATTTPPAPPPSSAPPSVASPLGRVSVSRSGWRCDQARRRGGGAPPRAAAVLASPPPSPPERAWHARPHGGAGRTCRLRCGAAAREAGADATAAGRAVPRRARAPRVDAAERAPAEAPAAAPAAAPERGRPPSAPARAPRAPKRARGGAARLRAPARAPGLAVAEHQGLSTPSEADGSQRQVPSPTPVVRRREPRPRGTGEPPPPPREVTRAGRRARAEHQATDVDR